MRNILFSFAKYLKMIDPERIFKQHTPESFEALCLAIFRFQAANCGVYTAYLEALGVDPQQIGRIQDIPFLPISLFKSHRVVSSDLPTEMVFTSSGTTGLQTSKHEVISLALYEMSFRKAFEQFYGDPKAVALLALLPSYQEREGSSLIYMVDDLIASSNHAESGYFLYNHEELYQTLIALNKADVPVVLLGVTYALLDFAEQYKLRDMSNLIVMETGGMKGRRREMIREELHSQLQEAFGVPAIHSEYGMTELLSQAYSAGKGRFYCPPWMRVLIRETNDPFSYMSYGRTGGINIIDLANSYSCSFLATQDLGRLHEDGGFEVMGRFDNSDIRGCNLLIA